MKPILTAILTITILICNAQDIIIYKDGNEQQAKVLKIGANEIVFKKYNNLNGPEYTKSKSNIFMIRYEDGSKDLFEDTPNTNNKEEYGNKIEETNNNNYTEKKVGYSDGVRIRAGNAVKGCGDKPQAPPTYNDPQYKKTKRYIEYKKELKAWRNCTGN